MMKEEKDKFDDIESILNGTADEALNQRYQKDIDFNKEVKLYKGIKSALRDEEAIKMEKLFDSVEKELFPKKTKLRSLRYVWTAVAASVILVASFWSLQFFSKSSSEQLFTAYFESYNLGAVTRSEQNNKAIEQANNYYSNQQFDLAAEAFQLLNNDYPENNVYPFYLAVSLIGNQQAKEAIPLLERVKSSKQIDFHDPSDWYLAMAYLQIDNKEKAKEQLENIVNQDSKFKSLAKELLQEF